MSAGAYAVANASAEASADGGEVQEMNGAENAGLHGVAGEACQAGVPDPVRSREQIQDQVQEPDAQAAGAPFGDPLPEIAGQDSRASGFGLRRGAVLALASLGGLAAFGLWSLLGQDQEGGVKLDAVQAQRSRMRAVSPATSPDYRERLGAYSEQKSGQALAQGGTFVAPQEGVHAPEPGDPALAPRVRASPAEDKAQPAQAKPQPVRFEPQPRPLPPPVPRREVLAQRRERGDPALVGYLSSLRREPGALQTLVLRRAGPARIGQAGRPGASAKRPLPALLAPGTVLYAVNRVALDSDAPGPAMAEVLAGPLKGSRATGSFQRHSGHLALRFTSLTLPPALGGQTLAVDAWAVDPRTERTAIRSAVDNHYLERWGGLLAASFLEGFGEAVSRAGVTQGSAAYGTWQRWPRYDIEEQLAIGAGRLGSKAAGIFERNFAQPPTVTLDAGAELGILLLSVRENGAAPAAEPAEAAQGSGGSRDGDGSGAPRRLRLAEQAGKVPFGAW